MRKILLYTIGIFMCLLSTQVTAQAPNWSVNVQDYQYQMAIVGVINLDGIESTDPNDKLAAIINGEVRGVGQPEYLAKYNRYVVYMNIYHNEGSGTISFKVYDASQNRVVNLEQTENFEIQSLRGNTEAPVTYSHPRLSSESNILTFNLPNQASSAVNGTDISVMMPFGSNLNSLAASYTTSPLAKVYVQNQLQTSGTTQNNFSLPVTYKVIAADATTEKSYKVSVAYAPAVPQGIELSNAQLSESAAIGTNIGTLKAIDPDGSGSFTYTLVNGAGSDDNRHFRIDGDKLVLKERLDYETKRIYSFRAKAVDEVGNAVEAALQVAALNENDEKPQPASATISIPENQPVSTLVHTMVVTDPDGPSEYTYSFYEGNLDGKFSVHDKKGEVRIQQLIDFEKDKRNYELIVRVSDGVNEGFATLKFEVQNVNDEAPSVTETTISANETLAPGTEIYRLEPTDADGVTSFTYRLLDAANIPFAVDADGIITVAGPLDYETQPTYSLKIEIGDGLNKKIFTFPVQIINENDEKPQPVSATVSIAENQPTGSLLHTMAVTDPDGPSNFTFSIISGNLDGKFALDARKGEVRVQQVMDYETEKRSYELTIRVSDGVNEGFATLKFELQNVNDEKPQPVSATISIPENQPVATLVHTMVVTDPDGPSNYTFSIYDGNLDGKFVIHDKKGEVRVQQMMDYEKEKRTYNLTIRVSDGVNESFASLTFELQNVNDETPVVAETTLAVKETLSVGMDIHQLQPTDADGATTFLYRILNAGSMPFTIDADGLITVAAPLDYEQVKSYDLKIEVSDGLNKKTFAFPVKVINENDEAPVLITTAIEVPNYLAPGTMILQLEAIDADNDGSPITYSFVSPNSVFELSADGKLTTKQVLALLNEKVFKFKVAISDQVNVTEAEVTVTVIGEGEIEMEIANVITPNGDGYNDYWEIQKGYLYQNYIFRVFDMRGQEVFFSRGYHNNFWDGTFNGKKLPSGTYIYTIQSVNKVKVYKGTLNIIH
ncbi:cadherin domain-containing protein [Pontibacter oryzae]|uniref:Cadherin domain-containing protein n=1 Tax=Pontibacter oryzae TaxID=2304593 RepID=A0A399RVL4_9BACT|nr:cadherin domain-containing protein [Pontibacter oryzae]RIJ34059.1 hypothetical protein D1627_16985 [Pontibacter oryzae]